MKNIRTLSLSIATIALLTFSFSGCSSDDSAPVSDGSSSITGKAVDGYIKDAIVCLDLDLNGQCSVADEPLANTDATGGYSLTVTAAHKANPNFETAPIIVYGGTDTDTGKRFEGFLQAPNDGSAINVTPLTTLVQKSVENSSAGTIAEKIAAAETKLKRVLNITGDLGADPVADKASGNNKLIAASLSLQKSIQTLAKAAASDSSTTGKSEAELVEDMFKAFALGLQNVPADVDTSATDFDGLALMMDQAVAADTGEVKLLPQKTLDVVETAKQIGAKTRVSIENMNGGDDLEDLKQISMLIQQDLERLETAFANFSGDFNASTVAGLNLSVDANSDIFQDNYDPKFEGFKFELNTALGLSLSDEEINSFIDSLPTGFEPWDLYERADEITNDSLKAKITAVKQEWEDKDELLEAMNSEAVALTLPFSFYDYWVNENNGVLEIQYSKVNFNANNTLSFVHYKLNGTTWETNTDNNSNLMLSDNGWVVESSIDETFTYDETTNIISLANENASVSIAKDVAGETIYLRDFNDTAVTMPAGSIERFVTLEKTAALYNLWDIEGSWNTPPTQFTTFDELIASSSGSQFMSNEHGGLGFASAVAGQTSGTLVEYIYNSSPQVQTGSAGTWAYETLNNEKILVVTPNDPYRYAYDDDKLEYTIFSIHNGVVYRGSKEPAGNSQTFPVYNEIAMNAIKSAIENR